MVSVEHGNFIINDGGATARDVLNLIEIDPRASGCSDRPAELKLETEVEIIASE